MGEQRFIPKRPHKKSRAGCRTCKGKKVKCDEKFPSCGYCKLRGIPCHYGPAPDPTAKDNSTEPAHKLAVRPRMPLPPAGVLTPSSTSSQDEAEEILYLSLIPNPSPLVISDAGPLSAVDLRLMHHWSTSTFSSIFVIGTAETAMVLQHRIPNLAFRHGFLMQGLLGAASLHLQRMLPYPQQVRKRTDIYRARALRTFRQSLDHVVPDTDSYNASLMMSMLLVILCSQDYLLGDDDVTVLHWLTLYGGIRSIMQLKYPPDVAVEPISPMLCRHITDIYVNPTIPTILINMMRLVDYTDPDYTGLESYCHVLDVLGELYASLTQGGLCVDLYVRTVTFGSCPSDDFINFTRRRQPRSLVIMMFYLSFLKLVPNLWWTKGIAERDMPIIAKTIDPKYLTYMEVPLRIMEMTDYQEIADLLVK